MSTETNGPISRPPHLQSARWSPRARWASKLHYPANCRTGNPSRRRTKADFSAASAPSRFQHQTCLVGVSLLRAVAGRRTSKLDSISTRCIVFDADPSMLIREHRHIIILLLKTWFYPQVGIKKTDFVEVIENILYYYIRHSS